MRDGNSGQRFFVITADNQVNALVAQTDRKHTAPVTEQSATEEVPQWISRAINQTAQTFGQFISNIRST
ncbi:hypothetical protein [Hyphococcus sp. DH-69]|uniref:hypothetical protein n=1 Tax=Hyphococcus formosus TaxID=3143534 RepID=UPI00398B35F3